VLLQAPKSEVKLEVICEEFKALGLSGKIANLNRGTWITLFNL